MTGGIAASGKISCSKHGATCTLGKPFLGTIEAWWHPRNAVTDYAPNVWQGNEYYVPNQPQSGSIAASK